MNPQLPESSARSGGSTPDPGAGDSADLSAEDLLAECLALSESRWGEAIRDACRKRPDLAGPLDQLFRNVRAIDAVLRPADISPSSAEEVPPGTALGDFDLLERVGGGGMGVVYRARQRSLDRTVALKLIRPEHLHFEKSKVRFRRETEAISRLHHPGIVPLYEAGEEAGLPYFTMEFIEGQSIASILNGLRFMDPTSLNASDFLRAYRQGTPFAAEPLDEGVFSSLETRGWPALCCRIVARVAHGLEHAHRNGVVHRDIKPSNLMVTDAGRVVIVDFGLALSDGAPSLTRTGSHPGSLPYMSPEQLAGRAIDHRSDIYSLGVTLLEMLTLRCPFALRNPELARRQIASGTFDRPRSRNRSVSPEIEAVCLKAMDRDPARRYATASALAEDLVNAVFHRPIAARTFGLGRRAVRLIQRHPARTLAVASLLVAFVVGPALLAFQEHQHALALARAQSATQAALNRATESEQEAKAVSGFLSEMIHGADPGKVAPKDLTVRDAIMRSLPQLEARFRHLPNAHASILEVLSDMLSNLGFSDLARAQSARAAAIIRSTRGPRDARMVPVLVKMSEHSDDVGEAERLAREAIAIAEEHVDLGPGLAAGPYGRLGEVLYFDGRLGEAEEAIRKAIVRGTTVASAPAWLGTVEGTRVLSGFHATLGQLLLLRGAFSEARQLLLNQLDRARSILSPDDPNLLPLLSILNQVDRASGQDASALKWAEEALRIADAAFDPEHPARLGARLMVISSSSAESRPAEMPKVDEIITLLARVRGEESDDCLAAVLIRAEWVAAQGRFNDAIRDATLIIAATESRPTTPIRRSKQLAASALTIRAKAYAKLSRMTEAEADARRALALFGEYGAGYGSASIASCLAWCHWQRGDRDAAEEILKKALVQIEIAGLAQSHDAAVLAQTLAALVWRRGRFLEAEVIGEKCLRAITDASDLGRWTRDYLHVDRGDMYFAWGKLSECESNWRIAIEGPTDRLSRSHRAATIKLAGLLAVRDPTASGVSAIAELLQRLSRAPDPYVERSSEYRYLSALLLMNVEPERAWFEMEQALSARFQTSAAGELPPETLAYHHARVAFETERFGVAEDWAKRAMTMVTAQEPSIGWLRARARILVARCHAKTDEPDAARALLEEVRKEIPASLARGDAWSMVLGEVNAASADLERQRSAQAPIDKR